MLNKYKAMAQNFAIKAKPHVDLFLKYAVVELTPPNPADIGDMGKRCACMVQRFTSGCWKEFTVREALLNTLVSIEIATWFYMGEVIGKRHLVGYNV